MLTRDKTNGHENRPYLKVLPDEERAGGVRISRVANYTSWQDSTYKQYYYNYYKPDGSIGKSSGILLHFPKYNWFWSIGLNTVAYTLDQFPIEYAEVIEELSDGSKTVYHFSNYKEVPDDFYDYNNACSYEIQHGIKVPIIKRSTTAENKFAEMNSKASQRGKLMSKKTYDKSGSLLKSMQNAYDFSRNLPYIRTVKAFDYDRVSSRFYINKIYVDDYRLVTRIEESNSSVINRESFRYNTRGQIKAYTNGIRMDSLVYIADIPLEQMSSDEKIMLSLNIKDKLHEKFTFTDFSNVLSLITSPSYYITEASSFSYKRQNGIPYLSEIKRALIEKPQKELTGLSYDVLYKNRYDNLGRLIPLVKYPNTPNNINTKYIWGYGGLYPIAILIARNCVSTSVDGEFNDLLNINGLETIDTIPLDQGLTIFQDQKIRDFQQWEITTYEYIPYIGISKMKNPWGRITSYYYNSRGKIMSIYDHENNALSRYQYSTDKYN